MKKYKHQQCVYRQTVRVVFHIIFPIILKEILHSPGLTLIISSCKVYPTVVRRKVMKSIKTDKLRLVGQKWIFLNCKTHLCKFNVNKTELQDHYFISIGSWNNNCLKPTRTAGQEPCDPPRQLTPGDALCMLGQDKRGCRFSDVRWVMASLDVWVWLTPTEPVPNPCPHPPHPTTSASRPGRVTKMLLMDHYKRIDRSYPRFYYILLIGFSNTFFPNLFSF